MNKTFVEFDQPLVAVSKTERSEFTTEVMTDQTLPEGFADRLNAFLQEELKDSGKSYFKHFAVKAFKHIKPKGRHMNPTKITL